jgi:nitrous oxidase accessory protein
MLSLPALLSLLVVATASPTPPEGQSHLPVEHVVGPDGEYATITEAIDAAAPHDTVRVLPGLYREATLVLDQPLTLIGETGAILDGESERGLIVIESDSVTVEGLTLRDTGISFTEDRAAVLVDKVQFCTIRNLRVENAFFGIYLANSGDCLVEGNTLVATAARETRSGNGIHLWYSTRITIRDNRIVGHRDGIYFEFVEYSRILDNESVGNVRYGLHFMFSDGCAYRRNVFAENGAGVAVMYTRDIVMDGNDFSGNLGNAAFGLLLKDITDSEITGNRFRGNSVGIHAEGANRVHVSGNDFIENGWAVKIMANSEASEVVGNNFVGNSFDVSTNSRRSYSDFAGNYWDRYRGYDRDADGVGDVPFHPVRLFSLVVAQNEPALVLQRSPMVALLDIAEQVLPLLTPESLADARPSLSPLPTPWRVGS